MWEKLYEKRVKPIEYPSDPTRGTTLQGFLGGADFNEVNLPPVPHPGEEPHDLVKKFNSGRCMQDLPRVWGHPNIVRRLGNKSFSVENDVASWRRYAGEPVVKK